MFYFDVWSDSIALRWDGSYPEGVCDEQLVKHFEPQYYRTEDGEPVLKKGEWVATRVRVPLPTQGVPLRDKLKDKTGLMDVFPALKGRVSWNDNQRCFFLSLSVQNLKRLKETWPNIRLASGQRRVDDLRAAYAAFQEDMRKARVIRTRLELPVYDYKAPPLGEYQHRGTVYLTNVHPGAMFADCGVGKSKMVLDATERRIRYGLLEPGRTLICIKLQTMRGWQKDCANFTGLKAQAVWTGSKYKRKEKLLAMLAEPADLYLINHDGVRVLEDALWEKKFQQVVVDESTIMKGYRSPRSRGGAFMKSLLTVAADATWRCIMSGTPAPNDASDLWAQMKFIDPHGFLLEASWKDFKATFMKEIFFGDQDNPDTLGQFVMTIAGTEAVRAAVEPMAFRVRLRDVIPDLPPKMIMTRSLPMLPEQLKHYEDLEDEMMTIIDEEVVSVSVQLAMIQKLRQVTGGFLIDHKEAAHSIEGNPKLVMLDTLLYDEVAPDEKVVVFCQYRWEVETLEERYKELGVCTVYGENTGQTNQDNIQQFLDDPKTRLIVLHPRSAAHGLTLTVARYMVFYSVSYSGEEDYQSVKRIERAIQTRDMRIYYLLAEDSIDEIMFDVVQAKAKQQEHLIDSDVVGTDVEIVWKKLSQALRERRTKRKRRRKACQGRPVEAETQA